MARGNKPLSDLDTDSDPAALTPLSPGGWPGDAPASTDAHEAMLLMQIAQAPHHVMWAMELPPRRHFSYLSPAFERLWGRSVVEAYDDVNVVSGGIYAADRPAVEAAFEAWLRNPREERYDVRYRVQHPRGSLHWVHDRGTPVFAEDGTLLRLTGIAEELTETEHEELASSQRVALIAQTSPGILHSLHASRDGRLRFTFGSERLAELYGVPAQVLATDATAALNSTVHPADAARLRDSVSQSRREMAPWRVEYRIVHPQRGELWVQGNSVPVTEPDGSVVWHGVLTEVTAHKHTERALRDNQAQLASVFASLTEGLVIASLDGVLRHWNRAALEMHGIDTESDARHVLAHFSDIFELYDAAGRELPLTQWPIARIMNGEVLRHLEIETRHRQHGWRKVFEYAGTLVRDEHGQPTAAVVLVSDITQRKEIEAELQQLNSELEARVKRRTSQLEAAVKELEAFSYSVSHDLRAPLRAIDGFSQAVQQDCAPLLPPEGQRYLGIIRESAQKMGLLIDDLLAFSRLGRQALVRREVDTALLVRDALNILAPMREGRQVELRLAPLPPSRCDPAMLRQVWVNLLSNALKYTRKRERAIVEVGVQDNVQDANSGNGGPVFFVRDNGTGFDMRYAHKLFGVFERLHRAEDFEGTGVGLAIVQRIVQRHGGSIRAEAAPDRGATFYFTLGQEADA